MKSQTPNQDDLPRLRTVLWHGMRRRCPQCGEGALYKGWTSLHERCPSCDLKYLADEGDLWVYLVAVDRALFIFPLIIIIYFRLNNPGSVWFWGFCVTVLLLFVYTLPHRNGMGLSIDYWIRRKWGDLSPEAKTK